MTDERTYCLVPDCDEQPYPGELLCWTHAGEEVGRRRKLTRQERLQAQADAGYDTKDWEDR